MTNTCSGTETSGLAITILMGASPHSDVAERVITIHSAAGTRHGRVIHQWNISPNASITNRNAMRLAGRTRCLSSHGSIAANKALAATNGSVCLSGTNPVRKATKLARMPSIPAKNITMLGSEADRSGRARRIRLMLESVAVLNRNCRTPRVRVQQSFAMHVHAVVSAAS